MHPDLPKLLDVQVKDRRLAELDVRAKSIAAEHATLDGLLERARAEAASLERTLADVSRRWPDDSGRSNRMSLIEEGPTKQVRMAHLAIVGSHSINGVAEVHSELIKTDLVPDFYA